MDKLNAQINICQADFAAADQQISNLETYTKKEQEIYEKEKLKIQIERFSRKLQNQIE